MKKEDASLLRLKSLLINSNRRLRMKQKPKIMRRERNMLQAKISV